jgi:hypothetical protein
VRRQIVEAHHLPMVRRNIRVRLWVPEAVLLSGAVAWHPWPDKEGANRSAKAR